jgi:hypothetical protein
VLKVFPRLVCQPIVLEVIIDAMPVCISAGLMIQSRHNNIFWTPCVYALNNMLKDIDNNP